MAALGNNHGFGRAICGGGGGANKPAGGTAVNG